MNNPPQKENPFLDEGADPINLDWLGPVFTLAILFLFVFALPAIFGGM